MSTANLDNIDKAPARVDSPPDTFPLHELGRCYTTQLDGLHKMWNYLMVVSAAAVTLAWGSEAKTSWFIVIIALTFAGYAWVNLREIFKQHVILKKLQTVTTKESSVRFDQLKSTGYFETTEPRRIVYSHLISDVFVLTVILLRSLRINDVIK